MARYVIGDIHGRFDALIECLKVVDFQVTDQLITIGDLGDYNDGFCDVMETLIKINGINILGNHDLMFRHWLRTGTHLYNWSNGGAGTLASYSKHLNRKFDFTSNMLQRSDVPSHHEEFLMSLKPYHLTADGLLFVHAGFNPVYSIDDQMIDTLITDRKLYKSAMKGELYLSNHPNIRKVFVGHTITDDYKPFISDKLINLDTGAKLDDGYLTIMNIDTLEYKSIKI